MDSFNAQPVKSILHGNPHCWISVCQLSLVDVHVYSCVVACIKRILCVIYFVLLLMIYPPYAFTLLKHGMS